MPGIVIEEKSQGKHVTTLRRSDGNMDELEQDELDNIIHNPSSQTCLQLCRYPI